MADRISTLLREPISAQEAAQQLADPCRAAFKDGDLSRFQDELDGLWSAILTAAEQTPHDQQNRLVDVMRAIKDMPQPVHESDKKLEVWDEEQRWDQLPMFGAKAREQLDIAQEKSGQAYVNLNAFFARLTAAGVDDFGLFAIWTLREALEDPAQDDIAKTSPELLKAAAVWLIYAAEILAEASKQTKQFDGKIARPGASLSMFKDDPGWKGFCQERWNVWKTRLASTSLERTESLSDAKSLIVRSLERITEIEKI
ncbi:hypothetical protein ACJ41O_007276 [Fusarium nematophilum]